ncbi:MAG: DUF3592 domain-containing protein [Planctomycetia bacterium]|nr:DUF3592 domain-containing protein [Planctomycetia bacterium]
MSKVQPSAKVPWYRHPLNKWRLQEFMLFGGMFALGVFLLITHLTTWGRSVLEEQTDYEKGSATVVDRFLHSRPNSSGQIFYRPEIGVEYTVGDSHYAIHAFDRSTLHPAQGFIYTREKASQILSQYKKGDRVTCWYMTRSPEKAILVRTGILWGLFFSVIPLTLIILGAAGTVMLFRSRFRSQEQRALLQKRTRLYPTVPDESLLNESPGIQLAFRLPLAFFPMFRFIAILFLALLWNGMAWGMTIYLFSTQHGWFDFLLTLLFALIFCGIGFLFVPWIFRMFKTAFAIGPTILEISDHPVVPGRKHRLTLIQNGRMNASEFEVYVCCEEVTRFRQGTDTITNHREVYRNSLYRQDNLVIPTGQTVTEDFFLYLPIGAMHSMEVEHNEIRWSCVIRINVVGSGEHIRRCPIIVLPLTLRSEL